jgi:hypothetical protein
MANIISATSSVNTKTDALNAKNHYARGRRAKTDAIGDRVLRLIKLDGRSSLYRYRVSSHACVVRMLRMLFYNCYRPLKLQILRYYSSLENDGFIPKFNGEVAVFKKFHLLELPRCLSELIQILDRVDTFSLHVDVHTLYCGYQSVPQLLHAIAYGG